MLNRLAFLVFAFVVACAGTTDNSPVMPEDQYAPGMIPKECEELLVKSKGWGFSPDEKWTPKNLETAKEVMLFFSSFRLIPSASSSYAQYWDQQPNPTDNDEASKRLDELSKAQACDTSLTYSLLSSLLSYPWPKNERAFVKEQLLKFLFNQQGSFGLLLVRAVTLSFLEEGITKGYISGNKTTVANLKSSLNKKTEEISRDLESGTSSMIVYQSTKKEFQYSEQFRAKIAELLPLP
ncbi:MAG: hypothetical protein M9962_12255 [Oligoflexia bacterium]|nr:hypothetical protein [Oligoflexia bacterium]